MNTNDFRLVANRTTRFTPGGSAVANHDYHFCRSRYLTASETGAFEANSTNSKERTRSHPAHQQRY